MTVDELEVLEIHIVDQKSGKRHQGIVGNNFSSYVRDHDFSVRLPEVNGVGNGVTIPDDFGDLHGKLFQHFLPYIYDHQFISEL